MSALPERNWCGAVLAGFVLTLTLSPNGHAQDSPEPAAAAIVSTATLDPAVNLAAAANGARVVRVSSNERDQDRLIDGNLDDGWKSADRFDTAAPQTIVIKLAGEAAAAIDRVLVKPGTFQARRTPDLIELAVAAQDPEGGFEAVGQFRLSRQRVLQQLRFASAPARFVKLTILSIHRPRRPGKPAIGEIIVLAADAPVLQTEQIAAAPAQPEDQAAAAAPGAESDARAPPAIEAASLSLDKTTFLPGEDVVVHFTVPPGLPSNAWIGLLPSDVPHGDEATNDQYDLAYEYLGGRAAGVARFRAPEQPGTYDFRVHDTDSDGTELAATPFVVAVSAAPERTANAEPSAARRAGAEDRAPAVETAMPPLPVVTLRAAGAEVNVAHMKRGAEMIGGDGNIVLIDGDVSSPRYHVAAPIGEPLTVRFARPYTIHRVRLNLWDEDIRYSRFRVEGSLDGESWRLLAERADGKYWGWQDIAIEPARLQYVRVIGTFQSKENDDSIRLLELEAYTRDFVADLDRDLAFAGAGGRVVSISPYEGDDPSRDGFRLVDGGRSLAWTSQPIAAEPHHEIVIAFAGNHAAPIDAVVIHSFGDENSVKTYEVLTSLTASDAGFERVGRFSFAAGERTLPALFNPVVARFVKIRLLDNQGGDVFEMAEVEIFESVPEGGSPVSDGFLAPRVHDVTRANFPTGLHTERDILHYMKGGRVLQAPQARSGAAQVLNDGKIFINIGSGGLVPAAYPATFLFELLDAALVEQVNFFSYYFPSVTEVRLDVSTAGRDGPFTAVGAYLLPPTPWDDSGWHAIRLPPTRARYLRLTFDTDFPGDDGAGFTEFQVIEAREPGYTPILEAAANASFARGANIANAALGGSIVAVSSTDPNEWPARNLIDGLVKRGPYAYAPETIPAWSSDDNPKRPVDIVFAFNDGRVARLAGIGIDPTAKVEESGGLATSAAYRDVTDRVFEFEVWVAQDRAGKHWTRAGGVHRLASVPRMQRFAFPADVAARFVKLRLLSNYGGDSFHLGEVEIYEASRAAAGPSILAGRDIDIAAVALGGSIALFTSETEDNPAARLIDGGTASEGWISAPLKRRDDGTFAKPPAVVFQFADGRKALIKEIVLDPGNAGEAAFTIDRFKVLASVDSVLAGFEELEFDSPAPLRLAGGGGGQRFRLKNPVAARWIRIEALSNHGGERVSLGEVEIIEAAAPGYASVVLPAQPGAGATGARAVTGAAACNAAGCEIEPNDTPAEANVVEPGTVMRGLISSGETDVFRFDTGPEPLDRLTLALSSEPYIRTSLGLSDDTGTLLQSFDPASTNARKVLLGWPVPPGTYTVALAQPQNEVALVFDNSGSIDDSLDEIRSALVGYVRSATPDEAIHLLSFAWSPANLLEGQTAGEILHDCTERSSDTRECLLVRLIDKETEPEGRSGTGLYDAIDMAIETLGSSGNRAIILMTDGADFTSRLPYPELWPRIAESRVRIYTIGLGSDLRESRAGGPRDIGIPGDGLLRNIALASGGRYWFAPSADLLPGIYRSIREELNAPTRYVLTLAALRRPEREVAAPGESAEQPPAGKNAVGSLRIEEIGGGMVTPTPATIELILDTSGTMKKEVAPGVSRLSVAKSVLQQVIGEIPIGTRVGLRIFGSNPTQGNGCVETHKVVDILPIERSADRDRLALAVAAQTPGGRRSMTPIGFTLSKVSEDFAGTTGARKVILVTDGREECDTTASAPHYPPAVIGDLRNQGFDFRMDIVGFDISDPQAGPLLTQLAGLAGGTYYDAADAPRLLQALRQSLRADFTVHDGTGREVGRGVVGGGAVELPPGAYRVIVHTAAAQGFGPVAIAPGETTLIRVRRDAGAIAEDIVTGQAFEGARGGASVQELLARARANLQADRLTRPPGDNAFETYQKVLDLDPDSAAAAAGLTAIAKRYLALAEAARAAGDLAGARALAQRGLGVRPGDDALTAMRAELAAADAEAAEPAAIASTSEDAKRRELLALVADRLIGPGFTAQAKQALSYENLLALYEAYGDALEFAENGEMRAWGDGGTGPSGRISPRSRFVAKDGRTCREYRQYLDFDGKTERVFGSVACRQPNGAWQRIAE